MRLVSFTPRPVYCVVDHLYRDSMLAEGVAAGRFTQLGITVELGLEPDWLHAALPTDEEWRIEWRKFYYGLDLAHAFQTTGQPQFLHAWESIVRSWIQQVPIGADPSDVTGRRILNWIYAWNRFAASPGFAGLSDGLTEDIVVNLAAQVCYLRAHLTPARNHRTLELYALFIAALALPELDADGALLDFALVELHCNLLTNLLPDGVHCEASTHYHLVVLRSFLGVYENARRFGLCLPDSYRSRLELACEFALHCHRPDGQLPALSDSDSGNYAPVLELAGTLLDRPDFLYGATAGARGVPPTQRNVSFPVGSYFIQRSGWGEGQTPFDAERFLIFDCGPLGAGGHGHYDLLSVEIAAGGRPLIMDPGRYTYAEDPPNWRRWFKSTAAHNTVCIDGLDQTPYRRGKPKGPTAQGRLLARYRELGLDVLCGEAISPVYEVVHTRQILFVADEYWIIVDQLRGKRSHRYDLRFHLAPDALNATTLTGEAENAVVRAPGLALVFAEPYEPRIEQGWVAPRYGVKLAAPVVSVVADGEAADFVTLVVPRATDAPAPTVRLSDSSIEVTGVGPSGTAYDRITAYPDRVRWIRHSGLEQGQERHG